jgi:hypothetical protein
MAKSSIRFEDLEGLLNKSKSAAEAAKTPVDAAHKAQPVTPPATPPVPCTAASTRNQSLAAKALEFLEEFRAASIKLASMSIRRDVHLAYDEIVKVHAQQAGRSKTICMTELLGRIKAGKVQDHVVNIVADLAARFKMTVTMGHTLDDIACAIDLMGAEAFIERIVDFLYDEEAFPHCVIEHLVEVVARDVQYIEFEPDCDAPPMRKLDENGKPVDDQLRRARCKYFAMVLVNASNKARPARSV